MRFIGRNKTKLDKRDMIDFAKKNGCKVCLYEQERMKCYIAKICPVMDEKMNRGKCYKDKEGNCPYGNEVGTCFGYCWKDLLSK